MAKGKNPEQRKGVFIEIDASPEMRALFAIVIYRMLRKHPLTQKYQMSDDGPRINVSVDGQKLANLLANEVDVVGNSPLTPAIGFAVEAR